MLIKQRNLELIKDAPKTFLTAVVASTGTTLTVEDNTGFIVNDDYYMLGEPGQDGTEVIQNNASTTAGTSIEVDNEGSGGCLFAHPIGTPLYKIDYNQVEFNYCATLGGSKTVLSATTAITPDREHTIYEDTTTRTAGYYWTRFRNGATYSLYSNAIPYDDYTPKSLHKIIKKVRRLLSESTEAEGSDITDEQIKEEANDKQRDIAHDRFWSFYENTKSLSSVEDQFKYSLASDVDQVFFLTFKTQPLAKIDKIRWANLHWDSDTSSDPTHAGMWDDYLWLSPRPSDDAETTTLGAAITDAAATSITVADSSGFTRGDFYRFIIDDEIIYATTSTATTFTGCLRGQEGTTAAVHDNASTITERDIVYHYNEEPTDLDDMTDETKIPEPTVLAYGIAMELALKKEDEVLHDRFLFKYEKSYDRLRKKFVKKMDGVKLIKDLSEVVHDMGVNRNPNDFPSGLSGV